jgi:predicted acyl esterase
VLRRLFPVAGVALLATALLAPASHAVITEGVARATAPFTVQPSVNQVAVTGATDGGAAVLRDADGNKVASRPVDQAGSVLFRDVRAGKGYVVAIGGKTSAPVTVMSPDDTPAATFYTSQTIQPGYGYLETRDGTTLSINVKLPGPADAGPYPTVVEYSGYDPSNPGGRQPASLVAQLLGFATVGINLRGTGCSGGAWDYFETLQSLDGYDAIETIAAQPWVAHSKVGMVGISYPGITQLFVAQTRPPHLAAITPLSVLDDTYATLYPGGIPNNGFAFGWAKDRQADARPASDGGQAWAEARIKGGDTTCERNQALRLQAPDVLAKIRENRYLRGAASAALAPATFVNRIDVPVFIAGSWQDQETGSHFAEMLGDFAPGVPVKATVMNGIHADSLGPAVLSQWIEFLQFYVADQVPTISPAVRVVASVILPGVFGEGVSLAPDRFTDQPDYASALAKYEAEPELRVLFDVGAGGTPGAPVASFSTTATSWPLPGTQPTTYYFGPGGTLTETAPAAASSSAADTYDYDPAAFPRTDGATEGSSRSGLAPAYNWKPVPAGKGLAYASAPLTTDTVMVGTGSVDLWLQSTKPDVDVEVTISEVRPDGRETYVQSGWLRASQRALDTRASAALLPVQTHTKADVAPLPRGKATLVRVPLYPFGHVFRAGSQIRIVVQPPGGNRPAWAFDALTYDGTVTNDVVRSRAQASKVVLPVVSGVSVTTPLPACGSLRGQPCRKYVPLDNTAPGSRTKGAS